MIYYYRAQAQDAGKIFGMADLIQHEHFDNLVGREMVDYILKNLQSEKNICSEIDAGIYYYIIKSLDTDGTHDCGYTAFFKSEDKLFISKMYLFKEYRGKGIFRQTFKNLIISKAKYFNLNAVNLCVNKNNTGAIKAYEKAGLKIIRPVTEDIGGGFIKDDYFLEYQIK